MRSRWVDSLKRSISASPRHDERPSSESLNGTSTSIPGPKTGVSNPAYVHDVERCNCVGGVCTVSRVLEDCVLQGGVHHTHLHVLTYLGRPLRSSCCCYPVSVQWFRAVGEQDDFQVILGADNEWYTPTADDIGARVLVKVMIEDKDGLKTKMLEYGPIREDPQVRSKVEMYLDRKSVLFMGLASISVKREDNGELQEEELRESWTLLSDDRGVRLTCESSLLSPFERRYSADIKLEIAYSTPNEFFLYLEKDCYVRLRAESNTVRDVIVLTLRFFCKMAISDEIEHPAVAHGLPPLTVRKITQDGETAKQLPVGVDTNFGGLLGLKCMLRLYTPSLECDPQTQDDSTPMTSPALARDLPWDRSASDSLSLGHPGSSATSAAFGALDAAQDGNSRRLSFIDDARPSPASSIDEGFGDQGCQHLDGLDDDSLLSDANALINHAQKMGIQCQTLLRASKRISMSDIPNLEIVEVTGSVIDGGASFEQEKQGVRQRERDQRRRRGSSGSTGGCGLADCGNDESSIDVDESAATEMLDASAIDDLVEDFMADDALKANMDVAVLRDRYVTIFCLLQRELRSYKLRVAMLLKQLEEKQELNASFRKDIESLHSALTSMQLADKVYDLVSTDLQQLVTSTAADTGTVNHLSYAAGT